MTHARRMGFVWPVLVMVGGASLACSTPEAKAPPAPPAEPAPTEEPAATAEHAHHGHHGHGAHETTNEDWWPNRLDLRVLKENSPKGDPVDRSFDYRKEFGKLDLAAVKKDLTTVLTTSEDWWPADYGHYGGLMIRLAWHSAGTYRVTDGRGGAGSGTIRFAPLNSWPDNASLDKARRLLWPVKKKYGRALSWADLMVLAGNVSLESMGFQTLGFGGGREDVYEPTDINWGPETTWLADQRFDGKELKKPFGATQMGLIYVNPEGPGGKPDPLAAAHHIRMAFGRMAMNDEETVALIAGGHTLGKAHGAHKPSECIGPEPEAAPVEEQGLGWKNKCGTGKGKDAVTSGLEGAWSSTPVKWSHEYFTNLWTLDWELIEGPGGGKQWTPKGNVPATVPDAHDPKKSHKPVMFTTDLALKEDPEYRKITKRFYENPQEFEAAFARAWFKLTHRDMGPRARLIGKEVPASQLWQDPVPDAPKQLVTAADLGKLEKEILASGLTVSQLVETAWAAASSYRDTDMRGGANGARLLLAPQKDWATNEPLELAKVTQKLTEIQTKFNASSARKISMADLIVFAGGVGVKDAAKKAGHDVKVPFNPGRTDATQETTDVQSFAVLEPKSDGFRNFTGGASELTAAEQLVERADFLNLTAPEMTVLLAGLRVLDTNHGGTKHGVFTSAPGTLTNDFFVTLLDMSVEWQKSQKAGVYEAKDRKTGQVKWTGTDVDLLFGSNSQLRALVEVYGADDAKKTFVDEFVAVWVKVMELDRFDLPTRKR